MSFDRQQHEIASSTTFAHSTDLFPGLAIQNKVKKNGFIESTGEYWSSKQRQSNRIHEISYRACFKAELPRYFIDKFTKPGDIVFDPFSGRGTTVIEAALLGRNIISNDINPLSKILTKPRLNPPTLEEIEFRLETISRHQFKKQSVDNNNDLSMFFESNTLTEIIKLKQWFKNKNDKNRLDHTDEWIRMVATNRLTGHSPGFFSVYTLPPNQAVSAERQILINNKYNQKPTYRDTNRLILKKSKQLLSDLDDTNTFNLKRAYNQAKFLSGDAGSLSEIPAGTVSLVVTSPPFLDVVQYGKDNWLRCWFNSIDISSIEKKMTIVRTIDAWERVMQRVFNELYRIMKPGGKIAFEVGEVRKGSLKLEDYITPIGINSGFNLIQILINNQNFTKTAHIWGISNNSDGTNSNRILVFSKPG